MIVRQSDAGLYLITQPDHAALARRIMERWTPLHDAERRASILHAIGEHDNGWREPDDAPTVDPANGRVYDFITIPAAVRQSVWPRGITRLAGDPWAAALVAHHAITVYDRFRFDAGWTSFFGEITAARNSYVEAANRTLAELSSDYVYVRLGDLISLVFCNDWIEPQQFDRWSIQLDAEQVRIAPDSFDRQQITIEVPARAIPAGPYSSDAALRDAIRSAPTTLLHGVVSGAP